MTYEDNKNYTDTIKTANDLVMSLRKLNKTAGAVEHLVLIKLIRQSAELAADIEILHDALNT